MKRFLQPIIENRKLLYSLVSIELVQGVLIIAAAYMTACIVDGVFLKGVELNESYPMFIGLLAAMLLNTLAGAIKQRCINGVSLDFRNVVRFSLHLLISGKSIGHGIDESASNYEPVLKDVRSDNGNGSLTGEKGPRFQNNSKFGDMEKGIAFENITSPKLLTLMVETVDKLDDFYKNVLPLVFSLIIRIILFLIVMLYSDTITGLIFLFTLPIAPALLMLIGRLTKNASIKQWQKMAELNIGFGELLNGIPTAKIYGRTGNEQNILRVLSRDFTVSTMKVLRLAFASAFAIELITTLSIALIAVGIGFRLIDAHMVFRTAFLALLMAPEFYQPLRLAGTAFHSGIEAYTALQEILGFFNIDNVEKRQKLYELSNIECRKGNSLRKDVAIGAYEYGDVNKNNVYLPDINAENKNSAEDVDCHASYELKYGRYPYSFLPVFYKIKIVEQLRLEEHRMVAITGPSGCGKSTLLMFLAGLYHSELNLVGKGYRVAYVPQELHIFAASLRDNLTLFKEMTEPSDYTLYQGISLNEEARYSGVNNQAGSAFKHENKEKPDRAGFEGFESSYNLLKMVALNQWYDSLPNGMETMLGAKGAPMSNGQRHRLGLVRALLQQPDILLLDETTAGLEEPLEAQLLVMLKEYAADHTVIIVSHRRQVLEAADAVIKLGV